MHVMSSLISETDNADVIERNASSNRHRQVAATDDVSAHVTDVSDGFATHFDCTACASEETGSRSSSASCDIYRQFHNEALPLTTKQHRKKRSRAAFSHAQVSI